MTTDEKLAATVAALERYGRHLFSCPVSHWSGYGLSPTPCSCGLTETIARIKETDDATDR